MQPPNNSDSPEERTLLSINLAKEVIGRGKYMSKYKRLLSEIKWRVGIGILCVICIPFLPIIAPLYLFLYLIPKYKEHKHKAAVQNGILTNELSASQKTTVYLSGRDVSGILGRTDIEYSQSAEKASFNYRSGNGRYRVYATDEEGLFMLVPVHSKIDPERWKKGTLSIYQDKYDFYYQCEVVRVNGGYNHGDFGEKSPMGSNDCIVLVCKKASKIVPSKNLLVITASDAAQRGPQRQRVDAVQPSSVSRITY
jgi:hypothetical protein